MINSPFSRRIRESFSREEAPELRTPSNEGSGLEETGVLRKLQKNYTPYLCANARTIIRIAFIVEHCQPDLCLTRPGRMRSRRQ
jgi:hypothetical protein